MVYEPPKEDLRIQGNKAGRHKNPTYADMHPVQEWYVKIRNLTRKSSKAVASGQRDLLRLEAVALIAMGFKIPIELLEEMKGRLIDQVETPPTQLIAEIEKKQEEAKPVVSAFPKDL